MKQANRLIKDKDKSFNEEELKLIEKIDHDLESISSDNLIMNSSKNLKGGANKKTTKQKR